MLTVICRCILQMNNMVHASLTGLGVPALVGSPSIFLCRSWSLSGV